MCRFAILSFLSQTFLLCNKLTGYRAIAQLTLKEHLHTGVALLQQMCDPGSRRQPRPCIREASLAHCTVLGKLQGITDHKNKLVTVTCLQPWSESRQTTRFSTRPASSHFFHNYHHRLTLSFNRVITPKSDSFSEVSSRAPVIL